MQPERTLQLHHWFIASVKCKQPDRIQLLHNPYMMSIWRGMKMNEPPATVLQFEADADGPSATICPPRTKR